VNVSARDNATGKEQKITITASTGLSDRDIDDMVKNAETFAAEDQKRKELAEARNEADSMAYQTEKMLRDLGDKVDSGKKSEIEALIGQVRDAAGKDDAVVIRAEMEKLQTH